MSSTTIRTILLIALFSLAAWDTAADRPAKDLQAADNAAAE